MSSWRVGDKATVFYKDKSGKFIRMEEGTIRKHEKQTGPSYTSDGIEYITLVKLNNGEIEEFTHIYENHAVMKS
jgi:hypothetical protein